MTQRMDFAGFDLRTRHTTARKAFREAEGDWTAAPERLPRMEPVKLGMTPFLLGMVLGGPLQFGIYVLIRSLA